MTRTLILALTAVVSGQAQQLTFREPAPTGSVPTLRVDTNLVLVPVTVTDQRGAVVPNLERGNFILTEENERQAIISFSHETAPVSIGIVVDLSGSMANKIAKVRMAVDTLVGNLEADDEEFLVTFAETAELRLPFTTDATEIPRELSFARPLGRTALFDAVALAVQQMRSARNRRRVLFLISDGGDNHSRVTKRELRSLLDESDIQIHAIGIHDHGTSMEERNGPWVLGELAGITGGQHHMIDDVGAVPALAARMSLALHDRYLLGYQPTPAGPSGTFRRIEVKLVQPKGKGRTYIFARRGYLMP
jgi:Ca-activated chloride channel family protein